MKTRRIQRALYRSKEPSAFSLYLKIHFPMTTLAVGARGARHQVSGAVRLQGLILLHSAPPVEVSKRATKRGQLGKESRTGGRREDQAVDRPEDTSSPPGNHRVDVLGVSVEGNRVIHWWRLARGSRGTSRCSRGERGGMSHTPLIDVAGISVMCREGHM